MTINKAQGQTLGLVGICLKDGVFSHGQLYVALSRVGSPSQLKILCDIDQGRRLFHAKNIVFSRSCASSSSGRERSLTSKSSSLYFVFLQC